MNNLAHLSDYFGHRRTVEEKAPIWADGSPVPWISYPAISFLNQLDFSQKRVFEYGAGNSTRYWARRAKRVISVEHDQPWFEQVKAANLANTEIFFASGTEYVELVAKHAPHDVIVIDGRWRYDCAMNCLAFLSSDGMVILDNAERYPVMTEHFRANDLIQIDMIGHGPQHTHVTSTSLFLRRSFAFSPVQNIQPHYGPGMLDSIQVMPKQIEGNKPGSF
ncbi:MAG: hypothetical protein AB7I36_05610 [Rhodospirillaceae bacterium]